MNWFILSIGVAYLGGAVYSAAHGRWWWAALYALWGFGDFLVAFMEVKRV